MYELPLLPFLYQDLEPYIDTKTISIHYLKHQKTYLNNLNKLLNANNYEYNYNLEELLYHINDLNLKDKENILFNLGGVINHNLYWQSMSKSNKLPSGKLKEQINIQYGNFENFWDNFKEIALKLKGSGYTFLILKNDGSLDIINKSNQNNPISDGYIPLFTIDLWEHAYYLNYQNDRAKYIDNFKEIADFDNASKIYNDIII